jgi:hypothetical protein
MVPPNCRISEGVKSGEAIGQHDPVYLKSDGKYWKSNGTALNAAAECDGFCMEDDVTAANISFTVGHDYVAQYGTGLTPGASLYVSATAGALSDTATTGGTRRVARVMEDGRRIHFLPTK